ncbi:ferrous iron transporter B [Methanoculleus sp. YWC-01]|jgi:ferrous iron transport protein B|uniref:Ferrous iron transporter B n=1 Tax=Methanoculleus nereidis TaxID=2735141 RepID=A0ABU3YZ35_9EURY|nr:ferrous iron transporter B [Methanoculleus sp. YWC-01]MDV4341806.1 ferrous iron transporter B [Methanoculleus sp. YWC-01]
MKTVVLMGNPNVGKSGIFSRLTGTRVITSNYAGTTVDVSRGKTRLPDGPAEVIDAPGTYSLTPTNPAEEVAAEILGEADVVVNVVDATNLERNLYLTLETLERGVPAAVALNLWDEAGHQGITIDVDGLEELLGVPVVPTVGLSGEGIRELVERLGEARPSATIQPMSEEERWVAVGRITGEVQKIAHRHHTLADRLAEASIRPTSGIFIALAVIAAAFLAVRWIGEGLISFVFEPLFDLYTPIVMRASELLGPGILHDILIGRLIGGEIDYVESMGLLTTGLFVPFAMILPYIVAFYLILSILEDTGYLPRLATLADTFFHRLGMHGYGIIPVFLGFGCNVPGALATRVLETKKQRFIAATLMSLAIPCMAQIAMVFGVLGPFGLQYVVMVFATLALVYVVAGLILNRVVPGECPEIFLEIPPYRAPDLRATATKTWMRVRGFVGEAIPYLFLGILVVNLLYSVGFLDLLAAAFAPVMETWLGLPAGAAVALLVGFLRKDLAVGMLVPLGMSPEQLVIAVTMLTIYFPCVATFVVLLRELGARGMLAAAGVMVTTALLVGGALRVILIGF